MPKIWALVLDWFSLIVLISLNFGIFCCIILDCDLLFEQLPRLA